MAKRNVGLILVVAIGIATAVGVALRDDRLPPVPTASPTAAVTTPAISPTPTAPTATAAPSPTATASPAQGRFANAVLGYSIELPPSWHRTECGSFTPRPTGPFTGLDTFIGIPERDFTLGGVGGVNVDHVSVFARENPQRLSPRAWASDTAGAGPLATDLTDITFAGQPAVTGRLRPQGATEGVAVFVAQGDRMFQITRGLVFASSGGPLVDRIVGSFRFEPGLPLPSPTPALSPARSAEQVADMVADAFARKDVDALGRLMSGCMQIGAQNGGGSGRPREGYIEDLRQQLARGLVVTVRTRPIERDTRTPETQFIAQAVWRDPGQAEREVDLWIRQDGAAWLWSGTIFFNVPRRSP